MEIVGVWVALAVFAFAIIYLVRKKTAAALLFGFVISTLVWRVASTAYIDLTGPVLASQLFMLLGPGSMTTIHVLAYLVVLAPILYFFRESELERWALSHRRAPFYAAVGARFTFSDAVFYCSVLFLVLLFADLARRGTIPLLHGLERFVYTQTLAGPFHAWLIKYGNLVCFWWGCMFAIQKMRFGVNDFRFLYLMAATFSYTFLTGNRFSAFYSFGLMFLAPYAAVLAVKEPSNSRSFAAVPGWSKIGLVVSLVLMAVGIAHNLLRVRGYTLQTSVLDFWERSLVQPSEMGWASYLRVFVNGEIDTEIAFDALFVAPIDVSRNTTAQHLMLQTIGEPRTMEHIGRGFQFAGGFPEIYFEVFGVFWSWYFLLLAGVIFAGLGAIVLRSLTQGHLLTAFWAFYVMYGLNVMFIGGMLNFLVAWTYSVKIAALFACMIVERYCAARGRVLVPWSLYPFQNRASTYL